MRYSESMQFNGVLRNALFCEEIGNFDPLIALKLNDLTHLLIVHEVAVASELLHRVCESNSQVAVNGKPS